MMATLVGHLPRATSVVTTLASSGIASVADAWGRWLVLPLVLIQGGKWIWNLRKRAISGQIDLAATLLEVATARDMKVRCALAAPWFVLALVRKQDMKARWIRAALATREPLPLVPAARSSAWPVKGFTDEEKGSRWVLPRSVHTPLAKRFLWAY